MEQLQKASSKHSGLRGNAADKTPRDAAKIEEDRNERRRQAIEAYYDLIQPIASESGPVIMDKVNRFAETNDVLMKALDEVAHVHPFINVAIVTFKAVVTLEMDRRDNDQRIIILYVKMQETMATMLELDDLHNLKDGPVPDDLKEWVGNVRADIEDCGSTCDAYQKKHVISRLVKSVFWKPKLQGYIDLFDERKQELHLLLTKLSARGIRKVSEKLDNVQKLISVDVHQTKQLFQQLQPAREKELSERLKENGVRERFPDDSELRNLLPYVSESDAEHVDEDTRTFITIKEEINEDLVMNLADNRKQFDIRLKEQTETLITKMGGAVAYEGGRIVDKIGQGPHGRIKDPTLREIWKNERWAGCTNTKKFIIALKEHYLEELNTQISDLSSSCSSSAADIHLNKFTKSDEWTLRYFGPARFAALTDALDEDASGFITIREVNLFVDMCPTDWSLPKWIAYWAAGFRISISLYCDRIKLLLKRMRLQAEGSLRANRQRLNNFLTCKSFNQLDRVLAGISDAQEREDLDVNDADLMAIVRRHDANEEERIRSRLEDYNWRMDDSSALSSVVGLGRIEMHLLPLTFLLLKRAYQVIEMGGRVVFSDNALECIDHSLTQVWQEVHSRIGSLRDAFRSNRLKPMVQFKRFCLGMFSISGTPKQNTAFMISDYFKPKIYDKPKFVGMDPIVESAGDATKLLKYPIIKSMLDADAASPGNSDLKGLWLGREHISDTLLGCLTLLSIRNVSHDGSLSGAGIKPWPGSDAGVRGLTHFGSNDYFVMTGTHSVHDGMSVVGLTFVKPDEPDGGGDSRFYCAKLQTNRHSGDILTGYWSFDQPGSGSENVGWFAGQSDWAVGHFELQRVSLAGSPTELRLLQSECSPSQFRDGYRILKELFSEERYLAVFPRECKNCMKKIVQTRYVCLDCTPEHKLPSGEAVDICVDCVEKSFTKQGGSMWHHRPSHILIQSRIRIYTGNLFRAMETHNKTKKIFRSKSNRCDRIGRGTPIICNTRNSPEMLQGQLCLKCGGQVEREPVWVCINCSDMTYICTQCNKKETNSKSWALSLPYTKDEPHKHDWSHALVLCQPENPPQRPKPTHERFNARGAQMEKRLDELEKAVFSHLGKT